jgi:prefoldin subunit 5
MNRLEYINQRQIELERKIMHLQERLFQLELKKREIDRLKVRCSERNKFIEEVLVKLKMTLDR